LRSRCNVDRVKNALRISRRDDARGSITADDDAGAYHPFAMVSDADSLLGTAFISPTAGSLAENRFFGSAFM
jgi:hypothetical protein